MGAMTQYCPTTFFFIFPLKGEKILNNLFTAVTKTVNTRHKDYCRLTNTVDVVQAKTARSQAIRRFLQPWLSNFLLLTKGKSVAFSGYVQQAPHWWGRENIP